MVLLTGYTEKLNLLDKLFVTRGYFFATIFWQKKSVNLNSFVRETFYIPYIYLAKIRRILIYSVSLLSSYPNPIPTHQSNLTQWNSVWSHFKTVGYKARYSLTQEPYLIYPISRGKEEKSQQKWKKIVRHIKILWRKKSRHYQPKSKNWSFLWGSKNCYFRFDWCCEISNRLNSRNLTVENCVN